MITHYDANDTHYMEMEDVLEPEQINDIISSDVKFNIIYIKGMAYELESYGEVNEDGSRKATLKIWKPF